MIRPTISIPSGNRRPALILRIHKRISSRTSNRFPHEIRHKCRKLFIYGSLIPLVYLFPICRPL
jgi:hypothetical protein